MVALKVTEFDPADALTGDEIFGVVQGAENRRTTLSDITSFGVDFATAAEFQAGDATTKALSPKAVFDAAVPEALVISAGAIAVDMDTAFNFTLTMTGDAELSTPTNTKPGQTGCFEVTQDGTGTRLLTYAAGYVFASATAPVLSTAAGTLDLLFYQILSSGDVFITSVQKGVA